MDPTTCPVEAVINFLTVLCRTLGYSFQTICNYRSATSKFHEGLDSSTLGSDRRIKRLTRACFLEQPPLPRYTSIWDVGILVGHLESMGPHTDLSTLDLGIKTLALLAILSISRQLSANI